MPFEKGKTPEGAKPFNSENQPANRGRTKGSRNVSTVLKEMLKKIAPDDVINARFVKEFCKGKKKVTNADAVAARIYYEGVVQGESWALKEISDRTEGKPAQSVDIGNKDDKPFQQKFIVEIVKNDGNGGNNESQD